ncbi:hypothetical protein HFO21_01200 [Rhizobium laguerreae]|uniref:hypothetical protein n=1 Tax=Rhizobium laguerreae TaxID=1076926 RepID=UPI001C905B12|nr:hypothetical protein [Rhizobium laguerreae]MBY3213034.1 hypothetical protein [Rhizobium laguerreae]
MRDDFIENPPVDPSMIGEAKTRMSYAAIRLKEMRGDEAKDVSEEKVLANICLSSSIAGERD